MKNILPERYVLKELKSRSEKYLPKPEHTDWERNVVDEFKHLSDSEIKQQVERRRLPFAFLMINLTIDYNLGAVVRLANSFGAELYYYGKKKFDRRGATGTYAYTPTNHLSSLEDIESLKEQYEFVGLEQARTSIPIKDFPWSRERKTLILLGQEACGLDAYPEVMEMIDYLVEIPMRGSVRSLNVATSAAIAAYDYTVKIT